MGFRSYIRQFWVAILILFRLSLPWGFAGGSGSIFQEQEQQQQEETGGKK